MENAQNNIWLNFHVSELIHIHYLVIRFACTIKIVCTCSFTRVLFFFFEWKAKWVKSLAHGEMESVPDNWQLFIWTNIHTKHHRIQHSVHANRRVFPERTTKKQQHRAQRRFELVFYRLLLVEIYGWCVNCFLLLIPYHSIPMCSNMMGNSGQQQ